MVSSFSNRSQQDIVAKMVGQIIGSTGNVTDFSEGSVIRSLVEAIAQEIYANNRLFSEGLASSIPSSIRQAFNLPLNGANYAHGSCVFYRRMLQSPLNLSALSGEYQAVVFSAGLNPFPITIGNPVFYGVSGAKLIGDTVYESESSAERVFADITDISSAKITWEKQTGYSLYRIYRSSIDPDTISEAIINSSDIVSSVNKSGSLHGDYFFSIGAVDGSALLSQGSIPHIVQLNNQTAALTWNTMISGVPSVTSNATHRLYRSAVARPRFFYAYNYSTVSSTPTYYSVTAFSSTHVESPATKIIAVYDTNPTPGTKSKISFSIPTGGYSYKIYKSSSANMQNSSAHEFSPPVQSLATPTNFSTSVSIGGNLTGSRVYMYVVTAISRTTNDLAIEVESVGARSARSTYSGTSTNNTLASLSGVSPLSRTAKVSFTNATATGFPTSEKTATITIAGATYNIFWNDNASIPMSVDGEMIVDNVGQDIKVATTTQNGSIQSIRVTNSGDGRYMNGGTGSLDLKIPPNIATFTASITNGVMNVTGITGTDSIALGQLVAYSGSSGNIFVVGFNAGATGKTGSYNVGTYDSVTQQPVISTTLSVTSRSMTSTGQSARFSINVIDGVPTLGLATMLSLGSGYIAANDVPAVVDIQNKPYVISYVTDISSTTTTSSNKKITVSWNGVASATSYRVYRYSNSYSETVADWHISSIETTATSIVDDGTVFLEDFTETKFQYDGYEMRQISPDQTYSSNSITFLDTGSKTFSAAQWPGFDFPMKSSVYVDVPGVSFSYDSVTSASMRNGIWPYVHRVGTANLSSLVSVNNGSYLQFVDSGANPSSREDFLASWPKTNTAQAITGALKVPSGTRVRVPATTKTYTTVSDLALGPFENYGTVRVQASSSGSSGNSSANSITSLVSSVYGISSVTNPSSIANGVDAETEQQWKIRFQNTLKALGRGTANSLEIGAKTAAIFDDNGFLTESVTHALVMEQSANTISLYVHNGTSTACSSALVQRCVQVIEGYYDFSTGTNYAGYKSAGIPVTVTPVNFSQQDIKIQLVLLPGFLVSSVSQSVIDVVTLYFSTLSIGDGFDIPVLSKTSTNSAGSVESSYKVLLVDTNGNSGFPSDSLTITSAAPTSANPIVVTWTKPSSGPNIYSAQLLKWNNESWKLLYTKIYTGNETGQYSDDGSQDSILDAKSTYNFSNPPRKVFQKSALLQSIMRIAGIAAATIKAPHPTNTLIPDQEVIIPPKGFVLKLGICEVR